MQPEPTGGVSDRDDQDRDDEDRVVSRRVENPTAAERGDQAVYQAANPVSDDDADATGTEQGGPGHATTQDAADEIAAANESEPVRSE
jgi:hypothetical protein